MKYLSFGAYLISSSFKKTIKFVVDKANQLPPREKQCSLCQSRFNFFLGMPRNLIDEPKQAGFPYPIDRFETINVKDNLCPVCMTGDVNRLIHLYLDTYLASRDHTSILEIAPIPESISRLKRMAKVSYRSADLYSPLADDAVDLQDMNIYDDSSFDVIICSHVLEHVTSDTAALKELYRITKPGGRAILMVPIHLDVTKTIESKKPLSPQENLRRFGQSDHVRLYSRSGFEANVRKAGFELLKLDSNSFPKDAFLKYGILPRSILYIGVKPKQ